jgi:hypothetical protein
VAKETAQFGSDMSTFEADTVIARSGFGFIEVNND